MKLTPVKSSNIKAIGYKNKTNTLTIAFNSGKTYEYYPVPANTYIELMAADSIGKYFQANIKSNPNISFNQVI